MITESIRIVIFTGKAGNFKNFDSSSFDSLCLACEKFKDITDFAIFKVCNKICDSFKDAILKR